MYRQKVTSSNIDSIGYDETNQILEVEFTSGSIYQYSNVPPSVYTDLMAASSHGTFLNQYVKDKYPYEEI